MSAALQLDDELVISEYKILHSAAGYYIGRNCYEPSNSHMLMPYDRATGYFEHVHEAQEYLEHMAYSWDDGCYAWPEDPQLEFPL